MILQRYSDRCAERRHLLDDAVARVIEACRERPDVREAFVFGSFAAGQVGPTSDLDVLVVRDTALGSVDRAADLKLAARSEVAIDLVVVTPEECRTTFAASSFGRTVLRTALRIYAA